MRGPLGPLRAKVSGKKKGLFGIVLLMGGLGNTISPATHYVYLVLPLYATEVIKPLQMVTVQAPKVNIPETPPPQQTAFAPFDIRT
jgi:hypothetical protein